MLIKHTIFQNVTNISPTSPPSVAGKIMFFYDRVPERKQKETSHPARGEGGDVAHTRTDDKREAEQT